MKRKYLFNTLLAILFATLLAGCKKTPHDFTVNYNDYEAKANHTFPKELLITEDNFIDSMNNVVEPYIEARLTSGYLDCKSGNQIYYEAIKSDESKAVVVFFHGFSEFSKKWNELAYYFLNMGYDVVRFDHHGHGLSTRLVDNHSKVFTKKFRNYVEDAHEVVETIAVPLAGNKDMFCFAHSMGGGVATYYMELYPDTFKKAALNCPMIGINCGKYGEPLTNFIAFTMSTFGNGKGYIPGGKDFVIPENPDVMPDAEGKPFSAARRLYYLNLRLSNPSYQTNAATYGWTLESVRATKKLRSGRMAKKLKTDILMLQSQNDRWVSPKMQNLIRGKTDKITLAYYPELEHEMFSSKDKYLYQYFDMVFEFLQ